MESNIYMQFHIKSITPGNSLVILEWDFHYSVLPLNICHMHQVYEPLSYLNLDTFLLMQNKIFLRNYMKTQETSISFKGNIKYQIFMHEN